MKLKPLIAIVALTATALHGQDSESIQKLNPTWRTTVGESDYVVAVNSITSACLQNFDMEYNGMVYPVVEFNVETVGGSSARFYFIDEKGGAPASAVPANSVPVDVSKPVSQLQSRLKGITESATEAAKDNPLAVDMTLKPTDRVVKKYPDATYAKTFEFRLASKDEVKALYQSLLKKWLGQ